MGYIKTFIMDNQGAGWKSFDELTDEELVQLEIGLMTNDVQLVCVTCFKPIQGGTGSTFCDEHRGNR
mgnify:CR=1 FL=1